MAQQTEIKTQIAAIKKVGKEVRKTKQSALKFLIDAGLIKIK
jgi:hypothetical protein